MQKYICVCITNTLKLKLTTSTSSINYDYKQMSLIGIKSHLPHGMKNIHTNSSLIIIILFIILDTSEDYV